MAAVANDQNPEGGFTEPHSLIEHSVENRREVAGRGVDDLQYLRGRGLLLQSLARLGQQPRILYCYDCLRGEIFEQRNLLIGERPHLLTLRADSPAACYPFAVAP